MENRIAILGIIVHNLKSAEEINKILHSYNQYIVGRMGIPYKEKKLSVMSIVMDAPSDVIGAVSGKLGMLPDVNIKAVYSK